ncbi:MAG: bifunctional YncE family protein/alkaline phosphatase family protein [Candidatus Eremiobacteraeota bacterium]|nr:bifunctional YncE family protein/alkaline phosphatase family protein [Candidatus Eremiobacteraeota bacterium]
MLHRAVFFALVLFACATAAFAERDSVVLPSGWRIEPPSGVFAQVGTMPQGIALSPDATRLAVVESGVNPPALRLLDASTLRELRSVPLTGAFGKPVWRGAHVIVAGANADALFDIDADTGAIATARLHRDSWPNAVAVSADGLVAVSNDADGSVTLGSGAALFRPAVVSVGAHPGDLIFSRDGGTLYVAMRGGHDIVVIEHAAVAQRIPVGLHPSALALSPDGSKLYVAVADGDTLTTIDTREGRVTRRVSLRLPDGRVSQYGTSPNALAVDRSGNVFVSCGAANEIAVIDPNGRRTYTRDVATGWYPSGIAVAPNNDTLYVANGKGEGAPANPQFNPFVRDSPGYVGAVTIGSVRKIDAGTQFRNGSPPTEVIANALPQWQAPSQTIVHAHGPIKHVVYIIKENRSYDQVLGDISGANGDPRLVQFGARITPNQHAIARRFGILDNAYTNSQVSADGHNWTDAAFANDYLERFWPNNYGDRRKLYDFETADQPQAPRNGYIWDEALRAHISFRDYGEQIKSDPQTGRTYTTYAGLKGHFAPDFIGWNLNVSDAARFAAWRAEFARFVVHRNLPQLEIIYLPNDHTAAAKPGSPTPQAYVALNDYIVGKVVDAISRSFYWRSTAIFAVEDDAQNGPDHVSDQRSTFYVASPYASRGVHHAHYSTVSVVRTIELLLGMSTLSVYDQTARPLYDVFRLQPDLRPFAALAPRVDVHAVNGRTAYGASESERMNFSEPDAADARVFNRILEDVASKR